MFALVRKYDLSGIIHNILPPTNPLAIAMP